MPEEWKNEWELSNECCKPCPFPDLEAGITEKKIIIIVKVTIKKQNSKVHTTVK